MRFTGSSIPGPESLLSFGMAANDLTQLIRRLHEALASASSLDPPARDELRVLARDLERLAAAETLAASEGQGVRGRLAEGVRRLEASHPELSRTLANLIDALALYGL